MNSINWFIPQNFWTVSFDHALVYSGQRVPVDHGGALKTKIWEHFDGWKNLFSVGVCRRMGKRESWPLMRKSDTGGVQ